MRFQQDVIVLELRLFLWVMLLEADLKYVNTIINNIVMSSVSRALPSRQGKAAPQSAFCF